jgi:predicted MFS family arabinose efflux permease
MAGPKKEKAAKIAFTPYQVVVIAILVFLQFTIILDFMILSPLGAILMPALKVTPAQFGLVVSVYAFSAGTSGFLAAGFADRFDRKSMLLFFYIGFILGTLFCGLAANYHALLAARMITGIFGGVIGSIVLAIATDLFTPDTRGRVMGFLQTAFASSQVLGIPLGLFLSTKWGWHAPFLMIVAASTIVGVLIIVYLKPINGHLVEKSVHNPLRHLWHTVSKPRYVQAFATTALLSTGGFMLMPFSSAFSVHNLGVHIEQLPWVYFITGLGSIFVGPLVGKATDTFGALKIFVFGTIVTMVMVVFYTHLGITPLPIVILTSVLMFVGIFSRVIPSSTLMAAVPAPSSRGAFMSVSSSLQQVSGGLASLLAGLIVYEGEGGRIENFDVLGYVVVLAAMITLVMMYFIDRHLKTRPA